jgi:hypothetical protein
MSKIDLEKYKTSWKKEPAFQATLLSKQDVLKFMQTSSKNLISMFKKGLIFDIVLKCILFILVLILIVMTSDLTLTVYVNLFIQSLILLSMGWQISIFKKLPIKESESQNALGQLNTYIAFYYKYYVYSIFNSALSSVLLFLIGSMFYLHFKYGHIPSLDFEDLIVLSIFIILGFGLSYYAQIKQTTFHIDQLKACVKDIETDTLSENSVHTYRRNRLRNLIMISILFLVGILLLIYLINQIQN